MKLTVVIPYYNRRQLLINTLESFCTEHPIDTVIVDDGSDKEHEVYDIPNLFSHLRIKILRLNHTAKWRGATTAFNEGFNLVKEGVILINSSECVHIGSVIDYIFENFQENDYIAFATKMGTINKPEWWGVRAAIGNAIPYCAAISKKNMDLLGGYDNRFLKGVGYDDYDFFHRVKNLKLNVKIVDEPYVLHQYHKPTEYPNTINLDLLNYLNKHYPNRIKANA
jgi:glycosyltransferase involved in cell wall biosynthesis